MQELVLVTDNKNNHSIGMNKNNLRFGIERRSNFHLLRVNGDYG